ncbi:hypothetical protein [Desulfovibrio sp. Huiquan2017]|uniref:hypothetical protein n=1 Tax=Desulfovibrio sp. Huiquan2017 TaxID=2816861 RepID=UPI001A935F46|nr:hypothetical protein [Desulfovibrio sp. Huiquan2017]
MNRTFKGRLDRLERVQEDKQPPAPGLVAIPTEDGFSVNGQSFDSVEDAQAAFPDHTGPLVVVNAVDMRRPAPEVPDEAA